MATGLRLDAAIGTLRKRLAKLDRDTRAIEFRPELERFTAATLNDAIKATPVRSEALITKNQAVQYHHRINYIPSYHSQTDPSLIVNDQGEGWILCDGKWYRSDWNLPMNVWAAFQELNAERDRRMSTIQTEFIAERKQARWLYRKSWVQVARSLGFGSDGGSAITSAHSRHEPKKEPPKGYGQWRGGKNTLSVVSFSPSLS